MVLNYERIVKENNEGKKLRDIWVEEGIDIKYETFKRAVLEFKATGHKRNVRLKMAGLQTSLSIMDELPVAAEPKTKEEIVEMLKDGCKISEIDSDPDKAFNIIESLKKNGFCIEFEDGLFKIANKFQKKTNEVRANWNGQKHIRIGVVSDTHIGSKWNQMSFLHRLYDTFEELGIDTVLHCGDVSDGMYSNRSDQAYELHSYGADAQVDYIVKNYPKKEGMTTHFITGNHDYTFIRNTGYNIGPAIALRRPDMKYLGMYNAKFWITPNCDIEMNHAADGAAYALSYSMQKHIDAISGGEKPKILLNGHHHKYISMFYRNIHAIEVPCTEAQTPFMKGKRIAAHMGGLVLDIYVDETGTIERFHVEMIPLYKAVENDY